MENQIGIVPQPLFQLDLYIILFCVNSMDAVGSTDPTMPKNLSHTFHTIYDAKVKVEILYEVKKKNPP